MIGIHKSFCVEDWPSLTARRVYSVVVFVIQFCLPLLATSCLYLRIYARLRSRRQARRRLDSSRRTNNSSVTGVRSPRTEIGKKCSESGSDRRSKRVGPDPARIRHLSPSLTRAFVPLCSENCRETCVGQIRKAQKTQPALESRSKCGSDRRSNASTQIQPGFDIFRPVSRVISYLCALKTVGRPVLDQSERPRRRSRR